MFQLLLTNHKCLTVYTGGCCHGHGTQAVFGAVEVTVQGAVQGAVHNWAVFYVSGVDVSRVISAC